MKRLPLSVAALTLILGPALCWAADQPAAAQPSAAQPSAAQASAAQPSAAQPVAANPAAGQPGAAQASNSPFTGASQSVATPPDNWTSLKGTVQAVDPAAKIVQLKDDTTGNLVQIPLSKQVMIQKDGKRVRLSQIKAGDTITLAKRNASSQDQEKPKSN